MDTNSLRMEIEKRRNSNTSLVKAESDLKIAISQYTDLDNGFKQDMQACRVKLESSYKEFRHYEGNWPIVYTEELTSKYPYYTGDTDDKCNPYFRMTVVKTGDPGIAPIDAPITRTEPSVYNRTRTYTKEDVFRNPALTALNEYPNKINELLDSTFSCSDPQYTTQAECTTGGGTWVETFPTWVASETAVGLLKAALNPWKTDVEQIVSDVYENSTALNKWQAILNEINNCLTLLPPEATYPNQTPNPTGPLLASINQLKTYAGSDTTTFVNNRKSELSSFSSGQEQKFFDIIKLRLHFINGSYSKLKAASNQLSTNASLIKDNKDAIASLSNMIMGNN